MNVEKHIMIVLFNKKKEKFIFEDCIYIWFDNLVNN